MGAKEISLFVSFSCDLRLKRRGVFVQMFMILSYLREFNQLAMIRGYSGFCRTSNKTHRS